ncbi:MAG: tRNA(5-methylaminomethyl-2-thiouridylate) methyltransferase [Desulfovibrionaceae bacterium]|nr:tRNA(5-methylaminomethyl-2-thiouridylate) methyltransferase [Desulfovibrionaceae bacterium]
MANPKIVVLFSGGLDSILAAKVLQEQGLEVVGLHGTSPFFGQEKSIATWENLYELPIKQLDLGQEFVDMLADPPHGFGKTLNPCVDCKILLLKAAKLAMSELGAQALATGEVLGQRPMSQRRDVLNTITREADVHDVLIRPLSALHLAITPIEKAGIVDRSKLLGINGRGRHEQLALAEKYKLKVIPTPAGGCQLTERENCRRYYQVLDKIGKPTVNDFTLANVGRQFWFEGQKRFKEDCSKNYWLIVGRNQTDNLKLTELAKENDCLLQFPRLPAPLALARFGQNWPKELLISAGKLALSYANKAIQITNKAHLKVKSPNRNFEVVIEANRDEPWELPAWEMIEVELKTKRREKIAAAEMLRQQKRLNAKENSAKENSSNENTAKD